MAKKKKWKKRLGKALMAGAALAGGLALAKNRKRNAMINSADANEGFGAMTLKDYGPHKIGGYHKPIIRRRGWEGAKNPSGGIFGMDATGDIQYAMPAKGGRIVKTKRGGVARRGLGRAFLKGRK